MNDLNSEDKKFLTLLYEQCPDLKEASQFVQRFKNLFRDKKDGELTAWINDALNPKIYCEAKPLQTSIFIA